MSIYGNPVMLGGGGGGSRVQILSGTADPTSGIGSNGQIYLKYGDTPEGYTPLEYLSVGSAGPYIDTGVANGSAAYFEVTSQYTDTPGNNYGIFGAQTSVEYTINTWNGTSFIRVGGSGANVPSGEQTDKHTFIANADGVSIDGTITGSANWGSATGRNYYLFAINYNGGVLKTANARIYSCRIWNSNTLVRNFVPTKRNSDDVLGMYDMVSGSFYTNAGTGSFVAGPDGSWLPESAGINATYAKVNGAWQDLIGTDINDIDLGS